MFLPICPRNQELKGEEDNETIPGGNETILLVEDEVALSSITREILESHGYTVIEAASATQALKVLGSALERYYFVGDRHRNAGRNQRLGIG